MLKRNNGVQISLPVHDSTLTAVHISWEAARCDLRLYPVGGQPHLLVFEGFTSLTFPRQEPWGPSQSVNSLREPQPGTFEIEIQSGDVLKISAQHWTYRVEVLA